MERGNVEDTLRLEGRKMKYIDPSEFFQEMNIEAKAKDLHTSNFIYNCFSLPVIAYPM